MKILVTGGGGFLGRAVVRQLLDRRHSIRSFSRGDYHELRELGVETRRGDLKDYNSVDEAVHGCDAVIHAGAKAGVSVDYLAYYETNVLGTQNVLDACKRREVPRLVYTSTPSVTFAGRDQEGADESAPYPAKYLAHYPKTKAIAERMVLMANSEQLATVALRPHLIWGPGDTQIVPRLIERARSGRLRLVGTGEKQVDATYIDNAARAHVQAVESLAPGAPCAGRPYFISNDEPIPFKEVLNGLLEAAELPPVSRSIPPTLAYAVGAALEAAYTLSRRRDEPLMTRFVARQFSTAHWYDITAAKTDLGYKPAVSMEEGMRRLAEYLKESEET